MASYEIPVVSKSTKLKKKQIQLIANGDLRLSCELENAGRSRRRWNRARRRSSGKWVMTSGERIRTKRIRATVSSNHKRKGWKSSARSIQSAPIIVAETVAQYSHHLLARLIAHRGPILTGR